MDLLRVVYPMITITEMKNKNIIYIIILIISLCLGSRVSVCASNFKILSMKELKEVDMIRQTHEYSCGAASLATLMNMFGTEKVSEIDILKSVFGEKLPVEKVKVGKKDIYKLRALNLEDLKKVAESMNFKVVALEALNNFEFNTIIKLKPAIVRLKLYDEKLHFVVIKDVYENWVYISDPAYGNFRVPIRQFLKFWEEGEKVLLTISNYPFEIWKDDDGYYISRNEKENINIKKYFPLSDLYYSITKINYLTKY